MNRAEFMEQLEYLLQDIPEEDREDAIAYYRDYLDEAGDGGEEQAIREFGSPERVAAIIRSELNGNLEDGGEFTEAGYQDERFRDPNYQLAKRKELPDVSESGGGAGTGTGGYSAGNHGRSAGQNGKRQRDYEDRTWFKRLLKVGLILILISIASPLALGIGGSALGLLTGGICLILAAIFCIGLLTITACIGAVVLLVFGIGMLFAHPAASVLVLGAGVLVLGLALIGIALSVLIYGKWIPAGIRWVVNTISNLLHRGGRRA